jgi:hypothetical protein
MVVPGGDDGIDSTEEFRLRIGAAEAIEDLLRMKEVSRGKSGRFGVEGVVGVSIGDCCWSCILNGAFVSDRDEYSSKCCRLEIRCSITNDQRDGQERLRDGDLEIRVFVGGKCLAVIIGDNDNEMVYTITVLTIKLSTLFFDLLKSRTSYSAVAVVMGVSAFFV